MSKESCKILSQFAKNTAPMSLKRLELYNNMSGDEGAIAIAEVIACCPHLEVFRWASNRSNEEGARALHLSPAVPFHSSSGVQGQLLWRGGR